MLDGASVACRRPLFCRCSGPVAGRFGRIQTGLGRLHLRDADVSLAGCSKIIGRAKDSKNNLAIAYFNRGIAYQNKGDHAKAITVAASRSLSPMARCRPRPSISRPGK